MNDLISRQAALDKINERQRKLIYCFGFENDMVKIMDIAKSIVTAMPAAQPETATLTVGRTRGSVTMWYECDACGEPVDEKDCYCRKCGRKLKHE